MLNSGKGGEFRIRAMRDWAGVVGWEDSLLDNTQSFVLAWETLLGSRETRATE